MRHMLLKDLRIGARYWWNDPVERRSTFVKAEAKDGNFIICRTEYGEPLRALPCELEDLQERA